jgi:hypothetical protein
MTDAAKEPNAPEEEETADVINIAQRSQFPVTTEPRTLMNCRDIDNWRERCLRFRIVPFAEDNWAGVFLGLGVGFLVSAWAAGGKHAWSIAGFGAVCLIFAAALGSVAWSKRNKDIHDLTLLADEMERARDANRVIQKNEVVSPARPPKQVS